MRIKKKIGRIRKLPWLIVVHGAPGTGKSALTWVLKDRLGGFAIEMGTLREIHLNRTWSNSSRAEEAMAFKNLVYMLKNYRANQFGPIVVTDLQDRRANDLAKIFKPDEILVVTLAVSDAILHKKRILDPKADRGFRRYDAAWAWNEAVLSRPVKRGELRFFTDEMTISQEINAVCKAMKSRKLVLPVAGKRLGWGAYFDMEGYFERHPVPPWAKKKGKHVNEGWERASL